MKSIVLIVGGLMCASFAGAQAASGTIGWTPNGGNFDYTINLLNTGSTTLDVFWFSWELNDYNFMPTAPTSITSPTGWSGATTTDFFHGYGIEWTTTSAPIGIGGSQIFKFTSATTPTQMMGNNSIFGLPVTYSVVYSGVAEASPYGIVPQLQAVPEPASYAVLGLCALVFIRRRKLL